MEGPKHLKEGAETRQTNARLLGGLLEAAPVVSVQARGRLADPQGYYNSAVLFDPEPPSRSQPVAARMPTTLAFSGSRLYLGRGVT